MTNTNENNVLRPKLDIYEQNKQIHVIAELPGVGKDNINLQVYGHTLIIEGVLSLPTADGEQKGHEELKSPYYMRTVKLSDDLDSENIKADFDNGLLNLVISKKSTSDPKKIAINFN